MGVAALVDAASREPTDQPAAAPLTTHMAEADNGVVGPLVDGRPYWFCGKPRLRPPWLGSSQRDVTTLPRVKK